MTADRSVGDDDRTTADRSGTAGDPSGAGADESRSLDDVFAAMLREGTEVTRRPTRSGSTITVVAATVATLSTVAGGATAVALAAIGLSLIGFSLLGARQQLLDLGALVLFVGIALGAIRGAAVLWVLLGTVAVVLAWDAGGTAMSMGRQLGQEVSTVRAELMRTVVGAGVGLVAVGIGYVMYRTASGGQPVGALVVMLLALVFIVSGLRL